jgi:2-polyprenyl-3-methyl-5-hydroxy-6-metoxy-1,4-benzoquinol methylase
MGIIKDFFQNTRKPRGIGGRLMLSLMNAGHSANVLWGLSQTVIPSHAEILDIGCGGGRNIRNLLSRAPVAA